ncbi:sugar ABC transporter substrate-binding protein [Lawsonibacter celer]|uniref:sugar ABC transporter substrate-binding protein n=1 Tax=Lawsonibacter celer TaxID=2986526 RepID=UPI001648D70F|nr:sugar ABC transporter substrate-binding protein [Lawsonibacter celer]
MKRIAAIALSLSLLLVTLAGCSNPSGGGSTNTPSADPSASIPSTGSPEGAKKIGLVQINTTNSYYVGASEAFHKGAEDFGYELDEQFAENSLEEEISIIENFIELGYDMIIADPQDAEALEDVFQKGRDAGVIMVSLRSPMANADYNCLINHYNGFYGSAVACFEALGGEGKVLLMQGQVGHEASDSRTEAFYDVLELYPNIELLDTQPCDWDPAKAVNIVDSWLAKYEQIDAILCETDGATPAVVNAVENAGRLDEILIAGNDGEKECLEYMVDGKVVSEAFFCSQRDGYHCMAYADAILRGVEVEKTVYLPLYACCSEEIQDLITANQPDTWDIIGGCTPEEALAMVADYSSEFVGMYG